MTSMIMCEHKLGADVCATMMNLGKDYNFVGHAADLRACTPEDTLVLSGNWMARQDFNIVLAMAKRRCMRIIHAS